MANSFGPHITASSFGDRYKIGDSFVSLPLDEVQTLLASSAKDIEKEIEALEERMTEIREEMQGLKVQLYGRFGRGINLET